MRDTRGITLIALIITIIVLLILAGISIASLTGSGLFEKAKESKQKSEKAQAEEEIGLVLDEWEIEKEINKITFEEFLDEKVQNNQIDEYEILEENSINIYRNGYTIIVAYNYEDITIEELTIGKKRAINTDKYGWKVTNYNVKEDITNGWRLFYQDTSCTYIISDNLDNSVADKVPLRYCENYQNGADVSLVGQKLNPMIKSLFTEENTSNNIRVTAWLTDAELWSHYTNEDALFAIGSPTLELIVASYNNRNNKDNIIEIETNNIGYSLIKNSVSELGSNHGIYGSDTINYYWLASPAGTGYGTESEYYVDTDCSLSVYSYVNTNILPVRPVVCIPTKIFNQKYLSNLMDV